MVELDTFRLSFLLLGALVDVEGLVVAILPDDGVVGGELPAQVLLILRLVYVGEVVWELGLGAVVLVLPSGDGSSKSLKREGDLHDFF